jgi:hypothetical protein
MSPVRGCDISGPGSPAGQFLVAVAGIGVTQGAFFEPLPEEELDAWER